jgi:hypothetical protein
MTMAHVRKDRRLRLKSVLAPLVVAPTLATTVLLGGATPAGAATLDFTTPGEHAFVVPAGNTSIHVVAVGGSGGRTAADHAGAGAVVTGDIPVTPGRACSSWWAGTARAGSRA